MLPLLADTSALEVKLAEALNSYDETVGRQRCYVEENIRQVQDQEEYERRFNEMSAQCNAAEKLMESIRDEILERIARKEKIRRYLDELKQTENILTEFDEGLWLATVESVTVYPDKALTFMFRDGMAIPVKAPKTK